MALITPQAQLPFWWPDSSTIASLPFLSGFERGNPPTVWDLLYVNNIPLPGFIRVHKCERKWRVQEKKRPGSSGANPTFIGLDPVEFDFELFLWTPAQLTQYQTILPTLMKKNIVFGPPIGGPTVQIGTPQLLQASPPSYSAGTPQPILPGFQPLLGYDTPSGFVVLNLAQTVAAGPGQATGQFTPVPIPVQHPALQSLNVKSIYFIAINGPKQWRYEIPDIFHVEFKTKELFPTINTGTNTPKSSQPLPETLSNAPVPPSNTEFNSYYNAKVGIPFGGINGPATIEPQFP